VVDDLSVGHLADLAAVGSVVQVTAEELATPGAWAPGGALQLVVGDVRDPGLALAAAHGAEVVVHLAANTGVAPSVRDPRQDCEVNVLGTLNYLEAARRAGVRRFVLASSGAPVGECDPPIHENLPCHPVSPYGASKLAGEAYCSAYFRTFSLSTVALRFSNVYGPLSAAKSSVVARFIRGALAGAPIEIYGDGHQTRDFIHVADLIAAIIAAARTPGVGGEVFQIATRRETSVNELVAALQDALAAHGGPELRLSHGAPRQGDVRRNFADVSKARERLGWQAHIGLREGLADTVAWFLNRPLEAPAPP
jgi:UDP-glucose 4-epimerase